MSSGTRAHQGLASDAFVIARAMARGGRASSLERKPKRCQLPRRNKHAAWTLPQPGILRGGGSCAQPVSPAARGPRVGLEKKEHNHNLRILELTERACATRARFVKAALQRASASPDHLERMQVPSAHAERPSSQQRQCVAQRAHSAPPSGACLSTYSGPARRARNAFDKSQRYCSWTQPPGGQHREWQAAKVRTRPAPVRPSAAHTTQRPVRCSDCCAWYVQRPCCVAPCVQRVEGRCALRLCASCSVCTAGASVARTQRRAAARTRQAARTAPWFLLTLVCECVRIAIASGAVAPSALRHARDRVACGPRALTSPNASAPAAETHDTHS